MNRLCRILKKGTGPSKKEKTGSKDSETNSVDTSDRDVNSTVPTGVTSSELVTTTRCIYVNPEFNRSLTGYNASHKNSKSPEKPNCSTNLGVLEAAKSVMNKSFVQESPAFTQLEESYVQTETQPEQMFKKSNIETNRRSYFTKTRSGIAQVTFEEEPKDRGDALLVANSSRTENELEKDFNENGKNDRTSKFLDLTENLPASNSFAFVVDQVKLNYQIGSSSANSQVNCDVNSRKVLVDNNGSEVVVSRTDPNTSEILNYIRSTVRDIGSDLYSACDWSHQPNRNTEINRRHSDPPPSRQFPWEPNLPRCGLLADDETNHLRFENPASTELHPTTAQYTTQRTHSNDLNRNPTHFDAMHHHARNVHSADTPSHRLREIIQNQNSDVNNNHCIQEQSPSTSTESLQTSHQFTTRTNSNPFLVESEFGSECFSRPRTKARRDPSFPVDSNCHFSSSGVFQRRSYSPSVPESTDGERRRNRPRPRSPVKQRNYVTNNVSNRVADTSVVLDEAQHAMSALFNDLQSLWINVSDTHKVPLPASSGILSMIGLSSYMVKNIEDEWKSRENFGVEKNGISTAAQTHQLLRSRLDEASANESYLRSELSYLLKEKDMMTTEIKELSLQLATLKKRSKVTDSAGPKAGQDGPFFTVPGLSSTSSTSMGFNVTNDPEQMINPAVKKREDDFASILNCVRDRGNEMGGFQSQIAQYDVELDALRQTIGATNCKMQDLERTISKLEEENKVICRERGHYEGILKLIVQEKQHGSSNVTELLKSLISKLNEMEAEINPEGALMEASVLALQEQNSNFRNVIQQLKEALEKVGPSCLNGTCQEEARSAAAENFFKILNEKDEEVKQLQLSHELKYAQFQEIHDLVSQAKSKLEVSLAEKNRELKKLNEEVSALRKSNNRHDLRLEEAKSRNAKLLRENTEFKQKTETLSKVVKNLRATFNEKRNEWIERERASNDGVAQAQEQSKWFQTQIASLTEQLADANERLKAHEKEKKGLAKKLQSAEEERKVVDSNLNELRIALQGGNVLTDALMERNDALKNEINRLRRAKMQNLELTSVKDLDLTSVKGMEETGSESPPPSEMGTSCGFKDAARLQPNADEKRGPKKNCFTSVSNYEEPRVVASMQIPSSERNTK